MKYYIYTLIILLFHSCGSDTAQNENTEALRTTSSDAIKLSPNRPNLNISILLDLSDRINPKKYPNPAMEYFERDLGYIHSIVESFELHLRNKRSIKINDHIQLYIDPEPADKTLNQKISTLNLTFTKNNAKREYIDSTSKIYDSISRQIYNAALEENNYVGSDIWSFFKSNVKDFCIEKDHRNILVILTDGYLYHKNTVIKEDNLTSYLRPQDIRSFQLNKADWRDRIKDHQYGFLNIQKDLTDLEILVLGINPDLKNPYEEDVIFEYWKNWFDSMNVKNYEIKKAMLPANMDRIIKQYILKD